MYATNKTMEFFILLFFIFIVICLVFIETQCRIRHILALHNRYIHNEK